jgi:hypothetical protein
MARITLNLESKDDLKTLGSSGWSRAMGLVPGEPNQGLVAELAGSPAREVDYDDSGWDQGVDIQERLSSGFTFAWYRVKVTIPADVDGESVAGRRVWFETNVDNYGEVYVDGEIDRNIGVITGNNVAKRILVADPATPGTTHTIAVLVGNAPLGTPVGTIFFRYATLALE